MMQDAGKILVFFGLAVALVGLVFYMGWAPQAFGWFGRLPGDIRIEKENYRFYFPITTGIILSILISLILRLFFYLRGN